MALRQNNQQVSPLRLKITLLVAGLGPLVAIGLWLLFGAKGLGWMLRRARRAGDLGSPTRGNE